MSVRRLDPVQPASFEFTPENLEWAKAQIAHYPAGKQASAVIALLWRAQEQHEGWLPEPAIRYVADMLDMAHVRVLEVATFYTMFQLSPVGKTAHFQVCGTTPCMLRGSGDLINVCKKKIAAAAHQLSADGAFSWEEVECLGACVNAPLVQVDKVLYEDLTPETFEDLLETFARGETPTPGPRIERQHSAPAGGLTSLNTAGLYEALAQRAKSVAAREGDAGGRASQTATPANEAILGESAAAGNSGAGAAMTDGSAVTEGNAEAGLRRSPNAQREAGTEGGESPVAGSSAATDAAAVSAKPDDGDKPEGLEGPRNGKADDLKRISGIGPKLEGVLHGLGIYHFDQIAAWSPETSAWVDDYLSFKGRIDRDGWIAQAKKLAEE